MAALAVAAGCGGPADVESSRTQKSEATSLEWGTVLGLIDASVNGDVNITNHPNRIACDLVTLGLVWARLDVGVRDTDYDLGSIAGFVRSMHASGAKVLVVVNSDPYTPQGVDPLAPDPTTIAWADAFVGRLNGLLDNTFTGDARVDAYEIGNEWNSTTPVSAGADAYLLDQVWRRVHSRSDLAGGPPLIVSGGALEARIDAAYGDASAQGWWSELFDSLARLHDQGHAQPFDAFGIHPYNGREYRSLDDGITTWTRADEAWKNSVKKDLGDLRAGLANIYGYSPPLWATEVGWSSSVNHPSCTSGSQSYGGWDPAASSEDEQANLFDLANDVLSGEVAKAFWYSYRDDEIYCNGSDPGQNNVFGLRKNSNDGYGLKPIASHVASALGGSASNDCYQDAESGPPISHEGQGQPGLPSFCPNAHVERQSMAVYLERLKHGASYQPPAAVGLFGDVSLSSPYAAWIEALSNDGITKGCSPGDYCPADPVPREQMAAFIIRLLYGGDFPSPASDPFFDVPASNQFAGDIAQLASDGITKGCGGGYFCPTDLVPREQMAAFLMRAEHGIGYVPPSSAGRFADVDPSDELGGYAAQAVDEGVMEACAP